MNTTTTTMTKEEEQTLTLLVKKLIKHTYKDAKPEYLSWLEDDFHTDFIDDYCNRKINEWKRTTHELKRCKQ